MPLPTRPHSTTLSHYRKPNHTPPLTTPVDCNPALTPSSTKISHQVNEMKRKGVQACAQCRKLHKKCSGYRPCERCAQQGIQCTDPTDKKQRIKRPYERVLTFNPPESNPELQPQPFDPTTGCNSGQAMTPSMGTSHTHSEIGVGANFSYEGIVSPHGRSASASSSSSYSSYSGQDSVLPPITLHMYPSDALCPITQDIPRWTSAYTSAPEPSDAPEVTTPKTPSKLLSISSLVHEQDKAETQIDIDISIFSDKMPSTRDTTHK